MSSYPPPPCIAVYVCVAGCLTRSCPGAENLTQSHTAPWQRAASGRRSDNKLTGKNSTMINLKSAIWLTSFKLLSLLVVTTSMLSVNVDAVESLDLFILSATTFKKQQFQPSSPIGQQV